MLAYAGGRKAAEGPKDPWDPTRRVLILRGYPPHRVEARVRELKAQQEAYRKAADDAVRDAQEAARQRQAEAMKALARRR